MVEIFDGVGQPSALMAQASVVLEATARLGYLGTHSVDSLITQGTRAWSHAAWIWSEAMFERIRRILSHLSSSDPERDEPPDALDDRDAGTPVPVRRGPPDRGSSVAVAEPDDDES